MMASIISARRGHRVLLLEKLSKVGSKLKATGGGRCNLSNTLDNETFMQHFGRNGRFMSYALEQFDHRKLIEFFGSIGVKSDALDGFRIFPVGHNSQSIIDAMVDEMSRLGVEILSNQKVDKLEVKDGKIVGVSTSSDSFYSSKVVIATGGKGYPKLGAEGDGYTLAQSVGHKITKLYPAMMPLKTKELWVANCRADTIPKAKLKVDIKRYRNLSAIGDLIFTKDGIRGPVVLDFSREITPLIDKLGEVPLLMNLTKGLNQEQIREHLKNSNNHTQTALSILETIIPSSLAIEICNIADIDPHTALPKGLSRDRLISLVAWTPLTVVGHSGFDMAMVTRGGVSLKEIEPKSMQSRVVEGLYFCGEVVDLDGPCGGYNLQWAFASGVLVGRVNTGRE
jgi:predicted Rossmann fold flavoprotein